MTPTSSRSGGPEYSNPGGGFIVVVDADSLEASAITWTHWRHGRFLLVQLDICLQRLEISSTQWIEIESELEGRTRHKVWFIGGGGRILKQTDDNPAVYEIRGDEGYVRAKVVDSNDRMAWTQPVLGLKGADRTNKAPMHRRIVTE